LVLVHCAGSDNRFGIALETTDHDPSRKVAKFGLHIFFRRQRVTFCGFINFRRDTRSLVCSLV